MKIFQKGFNYSQDGTGNRLVFHLQGCNMHCPWCSNPEGLALGGGKECSVDDVVNEAVSCIPMFFDGGGVTFTGGEIGVQFAEVKAALCSLKRRGINTAIETNGTNPHLSELFELTDEVMIDFKHPNNEKLKAVCGMGNDIIKQNIVLAVRQCKKLLIRIPFIGGFNDDEDTMHGFAEFFSEAGVKTVEILPYHEYGKTKWERLGLGYTVKNAKIKPETLKRFNEILFEYGIKSIRT